MAIVVTALLILMTCWSFWGWSVGDDRNIKWIRHYCGGAFVALMAILACGAGFMTARVMERSAARKSAFEVMQLIADRIEAGDSRRVVTELRALDHRGDPDEDAYDILEELPQLSSRLTETSSVRSRSQTAGLDSLGPH